MTCLLPARPDQPASWQMPTLCEVETLLGNAELAKLLGVSRQRVSQLVTGDDSGASRLSTTSSRGPNAPGGRSGRTLNLSALGGTSVNARGDQTEP